jgi:hypothetical protein
MLDPSLRRTARIAGVLYIVVIVCAGFAEGYVRASFIVPGDAAATAGAIASAEGLYRVGFAADLVAFLCDVAISVLLYVLLRPVSETVSLLAAAFRLVAHPAIASVNLLNHYLALLLVGDGAVGVGLGTEQGQALATLFLEAHGTGYLIGGAFFGVHLLLLGYLVYRATYLPRLLGLLLTLAAAGYLIESFGTFLFPRYETVYVWVVAVPAAIAEVSLALWLALKGIRTNRRTERRPAGASTGMVGP